MNANPISTVTVDFINSGMSIIPIDHTSKRPAADLLPRNDEGKPTWKPYQTAIVDEATAARWIDAGVQAIAVVGGKVSGGLLVLDFDVARLYDAWRVAVGDLADGLPLQRTGGGGYQVFLRCPDPGGNDKLAWVADEREETGRIIAIETRGEGGYAVIAPSFHPSGYQYEWLYRGPTNMPVVSQERADKLMAAARALDEAPMTRRERETIEDQALQAHRQRPSNRNGHGSVIEAFNQSHMVEALLESHGYTKGARGRFIRPGGKSESVSVKDGRSCHWSSNDPLNDGKGKGGCGCHDAFDLFTLFEHGGDVNKAVKAAAVLLRVNGPKAGHDAGATPREPWCDPQPLPAGLPPVMPFDFYLLPQALHDWVLDVSERMQCPPDYCAATAMIVAGALIGRTVAIRPKRQDDWQVVPNLFGMMVGRPSMMKSPAMGEILKFLKLLEVTAKEEYAQAMAEFEATAIVSDATKKVRKEEIKKAVKDGGNANAIAAKLVSDHNDVPIRRRYIVNDTTVEKLGVILNENRMECCCSWMN